MKPTIYVQIAAYRDPELIPTIEDMLDKAAHPDRLRIGVMLQRCKEDGFDDLSDYKDDDRFKIHEIDYREAKGAGYARYILNTMYSGEDYMMQIDSHHRFAEGWDKMCIDMMQQLRSIGYPKPLLTTYPPSYEPDRDPEDRGDSPCTLEFYRFDGLGTASFFPEAIPDHQNAEHPVASKFVAGGFIFADGLFCTEVRYDPSFYFIGEEMDLSVRAYMAGYDMFAPHKIILWHEYTREGKPHHWDDHSEWQWRDRVAALHNLMKYGGPNTEPNIRRGVRSLYEYEKYAGIEFRTRRVHVRTINKQVPPISRNFIEHRVGLVDPRPFLEDTEPY